MNTEHQNRICKKYLKTHKIYKSDMFLYFLEYKSVYKLNKCLLKKKPASHPLTGLRNQRS